MAWFGIVDGLNDGKGRLRRNGRIVQQQNLIAVQVAAYVPKEKLAVDAVSDATQLPPHGFADMGPRHR
jgi:hypothetical protein